MDTQIARDLADALSRLEEARTVLVTADDEGVVAAAENYEAARRAAAPAFNAVLVAYDADHPTAQPSVRAGADTPAPLGDASPGVPLLAPPGVMVNAENLSDFGGLSFYRSLGEAEAPLIEATIYALDAGTAVEVAKGNRVATTQPSRIVLGEAGVLGIVTNDVFTAAYEKADPAPSDPVPPEEPVSPEPPAEADAGEAGDS